MRSYACSKASVVTPTDTWTLFTGKQRIKSFNFETLYTTEQRRAIYRIKSKIYDTKIGEKKIPCLWSASELRRPSDLRFLARLVLTFADRGCCVVSATDSPGRYSRFSRPEPLLFIPVSSSVVLTRLSGPRSRPTASQKIWKRRESNTGPLDL
jgi:hypothetical protein